MTDVYAERREWLAQLNTELNPAGIKVTLVLASMGQLTAIWYWGEKTGFACGQSLAKLADRIDYLVFGGL